MAWLCKDTVEKIYQNKPERDLYKWQRNDLLADRVVLPKGSIKKLIGKELTFEDEPVEI